MSICKICLPVPKDPISPDPESSKQEETECHYCAMRKITKQAETLYKGFPSCFSCKRIDKEIKKPQSSSQKSHKHNKTSIEFNIPTILKSPRRSPGNSKESSLEKTDLRLNISTIFEVPAQTQKKHVSNFSGNSKQFRKDDLCAPSIKSIKNESPSIRTIKNESPSIRMIKADSPKLRDSREHSPVLPMKSGAFPGFEQELKKRGIRDLKIYEVLSNIMIDGLNSLKSKMIYSSARNKYGGSEFHKLCDRRAPLLFMIFLNSGYILGGYTYAPLDEKKLVMSDKLSGLYSLFGDKVYFYEVNNHDIKYEKNGFGFGTPYNLFINLEMMDESFCNLELKYKSPLGAEVTFKISQNFVWSLMVKEICVYKLS